MLQDIDSSSSNSRNFFKKNEIKNIELKKYDLRYVT